SRLTKDPKYTYVRLSELKPGAVVNVYGVVVFFKQPCRTRGTDFCTSLKITDQSNQSVCCNIFCEKLEDHPKIFRIGDIIRLHRVKTQSFNDSVMLINTFGTSVVTFDGEQGGPVEPRTSCRTFHFDQDDSRAVEELRAWRAGRLVVLPSLTPLSAVQPRTFFDLTCQLLAKASMDSSCTLLRVWDGSRCPHPQLKVDIGPDVTEGPWSFSAQKEQLIANILVFDNHVELAKELKVPGDFLRIYNLRAIPGSHRLPGLSSSQPAELHHLAFHLHGGTAYGRGIRVLPETCPEVQELKRVLDSFQDDDLHDLLEAWNTPPERPSGENGSSEPELWLPVAAGRRCSHVLCPERLSEVRRSAPGGFHHVRVQLRSFQPSRPHQLLKLYCSKCCSMQDVPDDDLLEDIFSQASRKAATYEPPPWALSGTATLPLGPSVRTLDVHVSKELLDGVKTKQLIFIMGSSLEEALHLTSGYRNVVPVTSSRGHMTLLDLSAPFLFRGRRRYYGCRSCSNVVMRDPCSGGVELMDEKSIAEALGVELMRLVFLMKLELRDATDSLHAYLWRDAELFFGVTAEDAAANQESQSSVCRTLESLCPKEGSSGGRPWLDLCLVSYRAGDDGGQAQTCYQVCHSAMATP
uniref:Protection of telomeres protein 1 n=1 Tax=Tetraodon nigroviridis TaxID=99883 RepID=H3CYH8_TETNG